MLRLICERLCRSFYTVTEYCGMSEAGLTIAPSTTHARLLAGHLSPALKGRPNIDLVPRFKSGAVRLLRIDARSGEWVAQKDF